MPFVSTAEVGLEQAVLSKIGTPQGGGVRAVCATATTAIATQSERMVTAGKSTVAQHRQWGPANGATQLLDCDLQDPTLTSRRHLQSGVRAAFAFAELRRAGRALSDLGNSRPQLDV